jgi:glycosyltransferase involved in cell wall biosynthesis
MNNSIYDPEFPPSEPIDEPLVSIVLPTHQRAMKLSGALTAIADQNYRNVEVIIVYTPDPHTERLLRWFDAETPLEVVSVRQTEGGMPHARNMGIEAASGEVIVFTDDDCIPPRNWLSAIVWTFENKNVVSVGGIDYPHPSVAHRLAAQVDIERKHQNQVPDEGGVVVGGYELRTFGGSNVAYDASIFEEYGVRHDEVQNRENDGLFQKRVLKLTGKETAYIPVAVLHARDYTFQGMISQRFSNGLSALEADGGRTFNGSVLGLFAAPLLLLYHAAQARDAKAGVGFWISDITVRLGMIYGTVREILS